MRLSIWIVVGFIILAAGCSLQEPVAQEPSAQAPAANETVIKNWATYSKIDIVFDYPYGMNATESVVGYPAYATILLRDESNAIMLAFLNTSSMGSLYDDLDDAERLLSSDAGAAKDSLGILNQATDKGPVRSYYSANGLAVAEMGFEAEQGNATFYGYAFELLHGSDRAAYAVRILSKNRTASEEISKRFISSFMRKKYVGTVQNATVAPSQANVSMAEPESESGKDEDICFDSDGWIDVNAYGNVTVGNDIYRDSCVNYTHLKEYSCSHGSVKSTVIGCENKDCIQGVCAPQICDADRYYNPPSGWLYNPGHRTTKISGDAIFVDYCKDNRTLMEYYCKNYNITSIEYGCREGYICVDGECQNKTLVMKRQNMGIKD